VHVFTVIEFVPQDIDQCSHIKLLK